MGSRAGVGGGLLSVAYRTGSIEGQASGEPRNLAQDNQLRPPGLPPGFPQAGPPDTRLPPSSRVGRSTAVRGWLTSRQQLAVLRSRLQLGLVVGVGDPDEGLGPLRRFFPKR
jgi:hypothetical protein